MADGQETEGCTRAYHLTSPPISQNHLDLRLNCLLDFWIAASTLDFTYTSLRHIPSSRLLANQGGSHAASLPGVSHIFGLDANEFRLAFLFAPPVVLSLIYRPFFGRRVGLVLLCLVSAAVVDAIILKSVSASR